MVFVKITIKNQEEICMDVVKEDSFGSVFEYLKNMEGSWLEYDYFGEIKMVPENKEKRIFQCNQNVLECLEKEGDPFDEQVEDQQQHFAGHIIIIEPEQKRIFVEVLYNGVIFSEEPILMLQLKEFMNTLQYKHKINLTKIIILFDGKVQTKTDKRLRQYFKQKPQKRIVFVLKDKSEQLQKEKKQIQIENIKPSEKVQKQIVLQEILKDNNDKQKIQQLNIFVEFNTVNGGKDLVVTVSLNDTIETFLIKVLPEMSKLGFDWNSQSDTNLADNIRMWQNSRSQFPLKKRKRKFREFGYQEGNSYRFVIAKVYSGG